MAIPELQKAFFAELQTLLPEWKYVKGQRDFKRRFDGIVWYLHVACINGNAKFDAMADVAVEYLGERSRICIVGAQLHNIDRKVGGRFPVTDPCSAKQAAIELHQCFVRVGMPFLERYADPRIALHALKQGGAEATLISPITEWHEKQIAALESLVSKCG